MELTDEQARTMAVCGLCQCPLPAEDVKRELEAGGLPSHMYCQTCATDPDLETVTRLALERSAQLLAERTRRAGLSAYYRDVVRDARMRANHEQN